MTQKMVLMELLRLALQTNFVKNSEISSFTGEMTKVRNYKTCNFVQNRPNVCGPCYYELNTTNKKNINIPR